LRRLSTALLLCAAAVVALALAGCEPRRIESDSVERLLNPGREQAQYRRLTLPNEVKVMLVSDPRSDRSAAAVSVGVGSLDDPPGRPGMAHFLEHMLFLGTEKYPEPGEYQKYLARHGGFSNAYTADDHTNYYFEVPHAGFEEALDRFAQFFVAPLFNEAYAGREVKAVDSEHSKNVENDFWRVRQVTRGTYSREHPINRFSTGTLETLGGVGNAELRRYYREQYSSNRMALAAVSNRSLDELEALVRGRFEKTANRNLPRHSYPRQYLKRAEALRVLSVEPIADERSLVVEFPLPPTQQLYESKPLRLIGFILGHEGEGSLLSLLKREDLASSLSAGAGQSTADYSSLSIRVGLTPKGLERYREVLQHLLGVITRLRDEGVPRYLFDENRLMAEIDYRFRSQQDASRVASHMSALMQVYPLAKLPGSAFLLSRFDPGGIAALLEEMRPDNLLVTLIAKGLETDQVEPYYGAKFSYREISGEPYRRLLAAEADPRWHLPAPNPYIPRRVALRKPAGPLTLAETSLRHMQADGLPPQVLGKLVRLRNVAFTGSEALLEQMEQVLSPQERRRYLPTILKDSLALPVKLIDTERARVWYLPDWRFRLPKAELMLKIYTEHGYRSAREAMLGRLYEAGIGEALNEFGYPIREAGLSYGIDVSKAGVVLRLSGYSSNMLALLQDLVARLRTVPIGEETFASIKERMRRSLQNEKFGQPYRQAGYYRSQLLVEPNFPREALERELEGIRLVDVQAFARTLFERIYAEGMVFGNLAPAEARAAVRRAMDTLDGKVLPAARRTRRQVRVLPVGANYVFSDRLRVNNSLAGYYYQIGTTNPRLRGAVLIISKPLGEQFYFRMRTRQQLGYIVYAGMGQIEKTLSLNLLVQSGAYPSDELLRRMNAFIPGFIKSFRELPGEAFEKYRQAVIDAKLERAKTFGEVAGRLFWIAFKNDEKFDHVSEDILAVEALSKAEVVEILENYLQGGGKRRLAIRLVGKEHPTMAPPAGQAIHLPPERNAKAG
jgi:insulysin